MSDPATTITGGKHGTKWIGALTAISGILAGVDPTLVPPKALPYVMGLAGILTVIRGAVNTSNQQQQ